MADSIDEGPLQPTAGARQGLEMGLVQYILNTGFDQTRGANGHVTNMPITASVAMEQKISDAGYRVELKAEEQPIPEGIKILLKMFGEQVTTTPISLKSEQSSQQSTSAPQA